MYIGRISGGGGGRLTRDACDAENSLVSSSQGGGGGGSDSSESVDPERLLPRSSGGGGNENVESVMQEGMISIGLIWLMIGWSMLLLTLWWWLMIIFGFNVPSGVPGVLGVGVGVDGVDEFMLSIEPRLVVGLRFSVPLLELSSLRRRLCRRVSVPPRSGEVGVLLSSPG